MRPLTTLAALCAALLLAGCGAMPSGSGTSTRTDAHPAPSARKALEAPRPIPITLPTFDAFRGKGLYYFDDNRPSRFYVTDEIAKNGLYPVREVFEKGHPHGFTWGTGAASILRGGTHFDPQAVTGLSLEGRDKRVVLHFKGEKKRSLDLHVRLEAYDLSGLPIGPYLVTRTNRSTPAGYLIGERYTFPKGSIGYRAVLSTPRDEVLIPTRRAFTGSATIEDFSKRFTKTIPYCLRYVPSKKAVPLGLHFDEPIVKQTTRDGKGRLVEKAQSGTATLLPVKKGTIFCANESDRPLAEVDWRLRYVNGTRTLEFEFPDEVDPANYGVPRPHARALHVAFAEERTYEKKKRVVRLVPARVWLANEEIRDYQWRFNDRAGEAILKALDDTKRARAEWDAKHAKPRAK